MTIKEALDLIEKRESSFFNYVQNHGQALSDLQLVLYAENVLKKTA